MAVANLRVGGGLFLARSVSRRRRKNVIRFRDMVSESLM
jgi:hypothetical protein